MEGTKRARRIALTLSVIASVPVPKSVGQPAPAWGHKLRLNQGDAGADRVGRTCGDDKGISSPDWDEVHQTIEGATAL